MGACTSGTIDVGKGLCREIGDNVAEPLPSVEATGESDLVIGVVTDVGSLDDRNFNQFSWEGALLGAATIGAAEPTAVVTQDDSEYAANIQSQVDAGSDIIITVGFAIGAATLEAATENPDVHFIGVDQFQTMAPEEALPNYESLIYNEAQAGYLAGIVAASLSESGSVAALGGHSNIPPVVNYMRGFQNGALATNEDANVILEYVTDSDLTLAFNDPASGKTFAEQFLAQNEDVDVLFQVAGKTGNGMLQAVEEAGIYAIGVDVDQWVSTPDSAECIVTSAEKKLSASVSEAIVDFAAGEERSWNVFLNAAEGMVGLAPYYQFDEVITDDIQGTIDNAFDAMVDGSLDVCQPERWESGTDSNCYFGGGDGDPGT
ncbi:MAG TPA: BMP family ABC transporter substrate-binding protein [Candidatus Limnocylindria bacterium]|nr:BMP family ABC transporter substrate-binding protein [Candidatus Limnocylindria bacterium]